MQIYIKKRTGFSMQDMKWIKWNNLGAAYDHQELYTKVHLSTLMHNWLNIGHQKQKFYDNAVSVCPICNATKETWEHIFQCEHDDAITLCTVSHTQFKSDLIKLNIAPIIRAILCYKVAKWSNLPDILVPQVPTNEVGDAVRDAVEQQSRVGWSKFMKGRVVKSWSEA